MLSLILTASMVIVIDPPQHLPCPLPGYRIVMADGSRMHAVSASYLPSGQGIVIVPQRQGRVFCDGFERPPL